MLSWSGNSLNFDVKIVDFKLDAVASLPADAKVDSMTMKGKGTMTMDLASLMSSGSLDTTAVVAVSMGAQGKRQSVKMNLKTHQKTGPTAPASPSK